MTERQRVLFNSPFVKLDAKYLRDKNCLEGIGEMTEEKYCYIKARESHWATEIPKFLEMSPTKAVYAYYGIVYTIIQKEGMWCRGKNGNANSISLSTFCKEVGLCNNARKTIGSRMWIVNEGNDKLFQCYISKGEDYKRLKGFLSRISDDISKSNRS